METKLLNIRKYDETPLYTFHKNGVVYVMMHRTYYDNLR